MRIYDLLFMNAPVTWRRPLTFITFILLSKILLLPGFAQTVPNVQQPSPGTLINGPIDPDMGRLSTIEYLGGYVITIPENPGSQASDTRVVKAWDLSSPGSPNTVQPINPDSEYGHFGRTKGPFLSHGTIKRDNEVFIGGGPTRNAIRLNPDGTLEHTSWSGAPIPRLKDRDGNDLGEQARWWSKGGMMRPWSLTDNWAYNSNATNTAKLTLGDQLLAEWNITRETGVTGFGQFMGNILIYASDQRRNGVAAYDATDIYFDTNTQEWKPRLLDVLNIPQTQGSFGGYWTEIVGSKIVSVARDRTSEHPDYKAQIAIVDFSDPTNLTHVCTRQWERADLHNHGRHGPHRCIWAFAITMPIRTGLKSIWMTARWH